MKMEVANHSRVWGRVLILQLTICAIVSPTQTPSVSVELTRNNLRGFHTKAKAIISLNPIWMTSFGWGTSKLLTDCMIS